MKKIHFLHYIIVRMDVIESKYNFIYKLRTACEIIVQRGQKNHYDDCYFWIITITRFSYKNKHTVVFRTRIRSQTNSSKHLLINAKSYTTTNFESEKVENFKFSAEEIHTYSTDLNYVPEDESLVQHKF